MLPACSTMHGNNQQSMQPVSYLRSYSQDADFYLQQAANSSMEQSHDDKLMAAGRLLQDGMFARAKQILASLKNQSLEPQQKQQKYLLEAQLSVLTQKPRTALGYLNKINHPNEFSREEQIEYRYLRSEAYARLGRTIPSIRQRSQLDNLLTDDTARRANAQVMWDRLKTLSQEQLIHVVGKSSSVINQPANVVEPSQGVTEQTPGLTEQSPNVAEPSPLNPLIPWAQLTLIEKNHNNSQEFFTQITEWAKQYPNHPGNLILPSKNALASSRAISQKANIALLLPLHGKLAGAGKAVRDGFMAAYYQSQNNPSNPQQVKIYDTSTSASMSSLYQQALNDNADWVIGPLDKRNVEQLASVRKKAKPVLALNYLPSSKNLNNFYQFGISPQDEATQVAQKSWRDGKRSALIIYPQGNWGNTISNTFKDYWHSLGGRVVAQLSYDKNTNGLNKAIQNLMRLDSSDQRGEQISKLLREKIKTTPRRRKDADMIFLIASPTEARQIIPLLKFYYAGNLPVYSTSNVYAGKPSHRNDRDMNGVIFCDMPWVFKKGSDIQQQFDNMTKLWPNHVTRYTRLYALGMDSYKLVSKMSKLSASPSFSIKGATGTLNLQNHRVKRDLLWAQFKNGRPSLIRG